MRVLWHGPRCPCCCYGPGAGAGLLGGLAELLGVIAAGLASLAWRFAAGQVVIRRPGEWDARWLTWAPVPPDCVWTMRGQRLPRSRWARRPGLHRQVARLGVVAALLGVLLAPALTLAAVLGAGVAAGAVLIARRRQAHAAPAPTPADPAADPWRYPELAGPTAGPMTGYDWPAGHVIDGATPFSAGTLGSPWTAGPLDGDPWPAPPAEVRPRPSGAPGADPLTSAYGWPSPYPAAPRPRLHVPAERADDRPNRPEEW